MTRPALLLFAALAAAPLPAAQEAEPTVRQSAPRAYVGAGIAPGVGLVGSVSVPTLGVFTREATLYADIVPRVGGGSGRIVTAVGVGGSVQVSRALQAVQRRAPGRFDIDVGARVGPSFTSNPFEASAESRARAFSVMLDPFVRATTRASGGRLLFAEVGRQTPAFRAGLGLGVP